MQLKWTVALLSPLWCGLTFEAVADLGTDWNARKVTAPKEQHASGSGYTSRWSPTHFSHV